MSANNERWYQDAMNILRTEKTYHETVYVYKQYQRDIIENECAIEDIRITITEVYDKGELDYYSIRRNQ